MVNLLRLDLSEAAKAKLREQKLLKLEGFPEQDFVCVYAHFAVGCYLSLDGDVVQWDDDGLLNGSDKPFLETDIGEIAAAVLSAAKRFDLPELLELRAKRPADKPLCATCKATGWCDWPIFPTNKEPFICWRCRGLGFEYKTHACTECDGRSFYDKRYEGGENCKKCRGYGWLPDNETA